MSTAAKPTFSVLLCAYNRQEKAKHCLEAISKQTLGNEDYEVVCVNDGSTDNTREVMLEALSVLPGVYIEHPTNRALAAARNSAIRASLGEFLVFINDDTYPEPEFLEQHLRAHRAAARSIAVSGFVPFIKRYRNRVFSRTIMDHGLYFPYSEMKQGVSYHFGYFITGNLSVPRQAFLSEDIWFDETFLRYGYEDIECGYRLWKKGLQVFYNPNAIALHDHCVTLEEYRRRAYDNGTNMLQVVVMHRELMSALLGTEVLTEDVIERWQSFVSETEGRAEELASQIAEFEDIVLGEEDGGLGEDEATVVKEMADGLRLVREYDQTKCFLQALAQYPDLRAKLEG